MLCADIIGDELIVTLTLKALPEQVPLVGVTLYTAVAGVRLLTRVRLPVRKFCPLAEAPPVKPEPDGEAHEYVVPDGIVPPVGAYMNSWPLHEEVLCADSDG